MKLCFNQATTLRSSTLERDLACCEKLGYDLIEIRLDQLQTYLKQHSINELTRFFADSRIKPYAFNALEFITFRDNAGYQDILDKLMFLCECGSAINCKKIVVVPTFDVGNDKTVGQIRQESICQLRKLAARAAEYQTALAFEFVGYPNCSVNTLNQACAIVRETDRDNVGLVLDCFHFYAMGSRVEDIAQIDSKKLFILHIDDSEDLPTGSARDVNRLWPGDGVIPLSEILVALKKIGYEEMVSVELFRPEYYDMDVEDCIRIARDKTLAVVAPTFSIG